MRPGGLISIRATVGSSASPSGHPGRDPAGNQAIFVRVGLHLPAAAVGRPGRRLAEQEALLGGGGEEPTPTPFLHERLVIERGLEPEQAQPESVLTARLAVAPARVAAELREDRHDLIGEIDRPTGRELADGDGNGRVERSERHGDRRRAVAPRRDRARGVDRRDLRVGTLEGRAIRRVHGLGSRRHDVDAQLLDRVGPPQFHGSGDDVQRFGRRERPSRRNEPEPAERRGDDGPPDDGHHARHGPASRFSPITRRPKPRRVVRRSPLDQPKLNRWGPPRQPNC